MPINLLYGNWGSRPRIWDQGLKRWLSGWEYLLFHLVSSTHVESHNCLLTPFPWLLMLFSGLCRHCIYMVHVHKHRQIKAQLTFLLLGLCWDSTLWHYVTKQSNNLSHGRCERERARIPKSSSRTCLKSSYTFVAPSPKNQAFITGTFVEDTVALVLEPVFCEGSPTIQQDRIMNAYYILLRTEPLIRRAG